MNSYANLVSFRLGGRLVRSAHLNVETARSELFWCNFLTSPENEVSAVEYSPEQIPPRHCDDLLVKQRSRVPGRAFDATGVLLVVRSTPVVERSDHVLLRA
jgi:hypothetical protein